MSIDATMRRTFSALSIPNYRRYFTGQAISLIGTWMQTTAQAWLVLQLTHSATALGVVVALQTLPTLLLGPYGGVVADRMDKRKLMIFLQSMMGVQAMVLAILTLTGTVTSPTSHPRPAPGPQQLLREPLARRSCSRWWAPTTCETP